MSWLAATGLALLALVYVGAPGAALAYALRLRGILAAAAAPLLGVAAIGVTAEILGLAGVPWTALTAGLADAGWLIIGLTVGLALRRRAAPSAPATDAGPGRRGRAGLAIAIGLCVAAIGFVVNVAIPAGPADTVAQSYDTIWHYDIVTWIIQHHDAATTHVGAVDGTTGASAYYPDAWHTIAAFLVATTGSSVPLATSAMVLAETVVLWPLGLMALGTAIFGRRPLVLAAAGALSGAATAFPWHFIDWGVLYANGLSMSLMPAGLALILAIACARGRWTGARTLEAIAALIGLVGFVFAQPNTIFTLVVLLLPLGAVRIWGWVRPRHSRLRASLAVLGYVVLYGAVWIAVFLLPALRRTVSFRWPPQATVPQSLGEALLSGFNGDPGIVLVPILSALGVVLLIRRRRALWLLAAYAITIVMYVVDNGTDGPVRRLLTGFWYTDERRLAAVVAVVSIVLAIGGVVWLVDVLPWRRLTARQAGRAWRDAIVAVGLVAASLLNLLSPGHVTERALMHAVYHDQPLLTDSEAAFMSEAAKIVPSGAVVANMAADGSAFGYSLDGIQVLFSSMDGNWLGWWGPDQALVGASLKDIATRPDVCAAVKRLHVEYVLNLDKGFFPVQLPSEDPMWLGMRIDPGTPGFTPLLVDGDRGLYRVDPC